jgi:hypothetical protein
MISLCAHILPTVSLVNCCFNCVLLVKGQPIASKFTTTFLQKSNLIPHIACMCLFAIIYRQGKFPLYQHLCRSMQILSTLSYQKRILTDLIKQQELWGTWLAFSVSDSKVKTFLSRSNRTFNLILETLGLSPIWNPSFILYFIWPIVLYPWVLPGWTIQSVAFWCGIFPPPGQEVIILLCTFFPFWCCLLNSLKLTVRQLA